MIDPIQMLTERTAIAEQLNNYVVFTAAEAAALLAKVLEHVPATAHPVVTIDMGTPA